MATLHRASFVLALWVAAACEPAPGSEGPCTPDAIGAECVSLGYYGSPCTVPCSFPRSCTFTVHTRWSGPGTECCASFPPQTHTDCVCEDGVAVCGEGRDHRQQPTNRCECHDLAPSSSSVIDGGDRASP